MTAWQECRLTPLCDCRLFRERLNQVKVKLDEVLTGKAGEYKEPLAALQRSMHIRTQVAGRWDSPALSHGSTPCTTAIENNWRRPEGQGYCC